MIMHYGYFESFSTRNYLQCILVMTKKKKKKKESEDNEYNKSLKITFHMP